MYLLDTTHCIRMLGAEPKVAQKIDELGDASLSTSIIVRGELLYGAYISKLVAENLSRIEAFLEYINVYNVDDGTSSIYAKLKAQILDRFGPKNKSKRRNIQTESLGFKDNDVWIAATAIQHGLVLVSADSDLLQLDGIEGLRVENW